MTRKKTMLLVGVLVMVAFSTTLGFLYWRHANTEKGHILLFAEDGIVGLRLLPGGGGIVVAQRHETITLHALPSGDWLHSFEGHRDGVTDITLSPDGTTMASAGGLFVGLDDDGHFVPSDDLAVRVWDVASGHQIQELAGHENYVSSVAFSADGDILISGSYDRSVRVWNSRTGEHLRTIAHDDHVHCVAASPVASVFVSGCWDGTVRLVDWGTGIVKWTAAHEGFVAACGFTVDGSHVITASVPFDLKRDAPRPDFTFRLWFAETGREVGRFGGFDRAILSLSVSPDGNFVATGGATPSELEISNSIPNDVVIIWDIRTQKQRHVYRGHTGGVTTVCFSEDGEHLFSAAMDGTVRMWKVRR